MTGDVHQGSEGRLLDRNRINIILMSLAFFLVFFAFLTAGNVEESVLDGIEDFKGSGYISLSIIYVTFSVANWVAPPVVAVLSAKWAMFLASTTYLAFIASFLYPLTATLYLFSVLLGLGAAVLWTAQGEYLTRNSTEATIQFNSSLFYGIFMCSMFGNLVPILTFEGNSAITGEQRVALYAVLSAAAAAGTLAFLALQTHPAAHSPSLADGRDAASEEGSPVAASDYSPLLDPGEMRDEAVSSPAVSLDTPSRIFRESFALLVTPQMLTLSSIFFYTGLSLAFMSGVYGTCLGNTAYWHDSKRLIGLSGVFVGVGEVLAALLGTLGKRFSGLEPQSVVIAGCISHAVAFFLVFLNIPAEAPIRPTHSIAYISPNVYLALTCSALLGFGDGCIQSEIMSVLAVMYRTRPAPAFALFKFWQSLSCAAAFFYSNYLLLTWQLLLLAACDVIGCSCFLLASFLASPSRQLTTVN